MDGRVVVENAAEGQVVQVATEEWVARRVLPTRFVVASLSTENGRVGLHSADGRVVWATPGQLATYRYLIDAEHNPDHDEQAEAEFLDAARIPATDVPGAEPVPPLDDPLLGRITFDPAAVLAADVATPVGAVVVSFDGLGRGQVRELLPATYSILDRLPRLLDDAVRFLWDWGAEEQDSEASRDAFLRSFGVMGVSVYYSGDFGIDLSDDEGIFERAFLDGHWPKVHFRADGTPVHVTIEA